MHAKRSLILGRLLYGGRHFTTLVMKTSDLSIPALDNAASKILPAQPINGFPNESSRRPGASPINIISADFGPSPATAFFLVWESAHNEHFLTSNESPSSTSLGDERSIRLCPYHMRSLPCKAWHKHYAAYEYQC